MYFDTFGQWIKYFISSPIIRSFSFVIIIVVVVVVVVVVVTVITATTNRTTGWWWLSFPSLAT
jgi:hypothetical protein